MATSRNAAEGMELMGHNHIGNRIDELRSAAAQEQDDARRSKLEETLKRCEESREKMAADIPANDADAVRFLLDDLDVLDRDLTILNESGGVYYSDLARLSPYRQFFGEKTIERIDLALAPGENDVTRSVRRNTEAILSVDKVIEDELEGDWEAEARQRRIKQLRQNAFQQEYTNFKERMEGIREETSMVNQRFDEGNIDPTEKDEHLERLQNERAEAVREWEAFTQGIANGELLDDGELSPNLSDADEIDDEQKEDWIYAERQRREIELRRKNVVVDMRERIPKADLEEIKSVLSEVRAYRAESLKRHLLSRLEAVKESCKLPENVAKDMSAFEKKLTTELLGNPKSARQALEAMQKIETGFGGLKNFEKRMESPELISKAQEKLKSLKGSLGKLEGHEKELGTLAQNLNSPSLRKNLTSNEGMAALASPQLLADLGEDLASDNLELRENAVQTIDDLHRKFRAMEAKSAQSIMAQLPAMKTVGEVIELVKRNAGDDHIQMVSHSNFESNYRQYTAAGSMVFREAGDHWSIIVDESALGDGAVDIEFFKKQVGHELRHLAFEFDDVAKRDIVHKYTNSENWTDIRDKFLAKVNGAQPAKKPPHYEGEDKVSYTVADWRDEDIISELMAMEGEIKNGPANANSDFGALCASLGAAGLMPHEVKAAQAGEPATIYRGYEGDDDNKSAPVVGSGEHGGNDASENDVTVENRFKVATLKKRIEAALNSAFVGQLNGGKEALKNMREVLEKYPDDASVVDEVEEYLKKVEHDITSLSSSSGNTDINPFESWWERTTFVSAMDVMALATSTWDFYKRRHQRREQGHAAKMGEAIFGNIPFMKEVALHSAAEAEKAEQEYVNEWKGRLENKDAWDLLGMIDKMAIDIHPDKDQLKAILRVLADKGRIDWNHQGLWKVLNKLQDSEYFPPNDSFLFQNPTALNQKLQNAMGPMWDYDEFLSLQNKNESSYNSRKADFIKTYDKMQGQLNSRLNEMLKAHQNGNKADPAEYEAILEYAIENGKSSAENIIFHLIASTADGLLTPDRCIHLDKLLNKFPALEYFTSFRPPLTQADFVTLCEKNFGKEYEGKEMDGGGAFQNFYWTVMMNNQSVKERVHKSVGPDAWDHDWTRAIGVIGGADVANRLLSGKSSSKATRPTAVQNAYAGSLQWLEENAKRAKNGDSSSWNKHIADQLGWAVMSDGILANVAYKSQSFFTRDDSIQGSKPRERGSTGHPNGFTVEFQKRIQEVLDTLDPILFRLMREKGLDEKTRVDQIKEHLQANYADNIDMMKAVEGMTSLDNVFNSTQQIVNAVVGSRMGGNMEKVFSVLLDKKGTPRSFGQAVAA